MLRRAVLAFAIPIPVALLGRVASADVLIVDASGGGAYTTLQAAVDAAQSGDTVLVKAGGYSGFAVPDKSLVIVAETGANVAVAGSSSIANLTTTHSVMLAGLRITGDLSSPALFLQNDAGPVRLHGCVLIGGEPARMFYDYPAGDGVQVEGGLTRAAFVGCTLRGGFGGDCYYPMWCEGGNDGGMAIVISGGARAALYDCTVRGGDGSEGQQTHGGDGGHATWIDSGFLHASNSPLMGGTGGIACDFYPPPGGNGGDALRVLGTTAYAWTVESTLMPGPGAPHLQKNEYCGGGAGLWGNAVVGWGQWYDLAVSHLQMDAPFLAREGDHIALTIRGEPGTEVALLISDSTIFRAIPSWRGVRIAGKTGRLHPAMWLGEIPAGGVLATGLHVEDLPVGVEADTSFLQVFGQSGAGRVYGSFAAVTVLDSAY